MKRHVNRQSTISVRRDQTSPCFGRTRGAIRPHGVRAAASGVAIEEGFAGAVLTPKRREECEPRRVLC